MLHLLTDLGDHPRLEDANGCASQRRQVLAKFQRQQEPARLMLLRDIYSPQALQPWQLAGMLYTQTLALGLLTVVFAASAPPPNSVLRHLFSLITYQMSDVATSWASE